MSKSIIYIEEGRNYLQDLVVQFLKNQPDVKHLNTIAGSNLSHTSSSMNLITNGSLNLTSKFSQMRIRELDPIPTYLRIEVDPKLRQVTDSIFLARLKNLEIFNENLQSVIRTVTRRYDSRIIRFTLKYDKRFKHNINIVRHE